MVYRPVCGAAVFRDASAAPLVVAIDAATVALAAVVLRQRTVEL
jgi:hypothetical protein